MIPTVFWRCWLRSFLESAARSRSRTLRLPVVGESSPAMRFKSVDLPEPDVPRRPTNSPAFTDSDTPERARTVEAPIR